ncbi:MAG: DNA recombination protein RmuC [Firmicutes bacterium ADurb.Bin373]|nr:MAG: DNA recombination protein RmuC [Firmicutes bacterium ADurb.Bin373]
MLFRRTEKTITITPQKGVPVMQGKNNTHRGEGLVDTQLLLGLITIALLLLLVLLFLTGRKKLDINEIIALLKHNSDEQRDNVAKQLSDGATEQFRRFGMIQESVQFTLQSNREETNKQLHELQTQVDRRLSAIQQSSSDSNERINMSVNKTLQDSRTETIDQLGKFSIQLDTRLSAIQEQMQKTLQANREETNKQLRGFQEQIDSRLSLIQHGNAENIEKINASLESRMKSLQESNEKRLEQMQGVVDEKLQKTLETRLAQSFELVGKQLDSVQQGLGEMKNLAADARSLKNALTNVKERGTYGEVRLEKLLSDILAPGQYAVNVEINNNKRVEFAVKLPGNADVPLLLPIDSKFPIEDYNRLLDAEDKSAIDEARKSLAQKIRVFAKDIYDKYISPPKTTDFALMFLPTEGLYAEVVQNVALFEELRDKYKVTAVGATTLSAFLGSLQMGFKTLAIEERSQEVWNTLRAVKSEFIKFGAMLDKAHKQIQTADKTLDEIVGKRTRAINRTLRTVEELGETGSQPLIGTAGADEDEC